MKTTKPDPAMITRNLDATRQKLRIVDRQVTITGHPHAVQVRKLFLEGKLRLIKVEEHGQFVSAVQKDLNTSDSICTYDRCASVCLSTDESVEIRISERGRDGGNQFTDHYHDRTFHLEGEWWLFQPFIDYINHNFESYAERLVEKEEEARLLNRRREIEVEVLAGIYNFDE